MKTYLAIVFLLFKCCTIQAQIDNIDSVYIYKYFPEGGGVNEVLT